MMVSCEWAAWSSTEYGELLKAPLIQLELVIKAFSATESVSLLAHQQWGGREDGLLWMQTKWAFHRGFLCT